MIEDEINKLRCAIEDISAQQQVAINNLIVVTTHLTELLQTKAGIASAESLAGTPDQPAPVEKKKRAPRKKTNSAKPPEESPEPVDKTETPVEDVALTSVEVKGVLMEMVKGGHSAEAKQLKEKLLPKASVDTLEPGDPILHKIHTKAVEFLASA
jgi:hypothetical protein